MMEFFRIIPNYEPYEVSNLGRLRNNGKILTTPISSKTGYPRKYLKDLKKNLLIHRAVAVCFISNPSNLPVVNHKNGSKSDNNSDNLEWCTRSHNSSHAYAIGLMPDQSGDKSHRAKLTQIEVSIVREALSLKFTQTSIAKYFKLDQSTISLIKNRVNWVN